MCQTFLQVKIVENGTLTFCLIKHQSKGGFTKEERTNLYLKISVEIRLTNLYCTNNIQKTHKPITH